MDDTVLSVSEFVSLLNQTLEFAYPLVTIEGEISDYRGPNRNGHHYLTLKDEQANLKCVAFAGTVSTVLEEGMQVVVKGSPNHHPKYGFSFVAHSVAPSGEGALKRAFLLLKAKLEKEGLFDLGRKRPIEVYPRRIGVISSSQAAGYRDFIKILTDRWVGVEVLLADVQVQGDPASGQIVRAFEYFNQMKQPVDTVVLIRGGGSLEDLQAFNEETVVRAVVGSRIPTIVGVGHEVDISLADLAADLRAATPSEAAQLAVPNLADELRRIEQYKLQIASISISRDKFDRLKTDLQQIVETYGLGLKMNKTIINSHKQTLMLTNPQNVLSRGYSIARYQGRVLKRAEQVKSGDRVVLQLHQGQVETEVRKGKK
ncbi:MAG: exodeoxyribonuclease VII large subunit [Candidatus Saccharimonadales bacterium]|nr:exodeoxyribonuclease VII large subunit [Candidatus Saccharimonadales bacterium]